MPTSTTPSTDGQVHTDSKGDVMQNGVPVHASDEEPHEQATAYPNSDRQLSETAATTHGGDAKTPKHDHGAGEGKGAGD